MPSLPLANSQQALNHTVSGVRVLSKIVPAVTEVRFPHPGHMKRPSARRHPPPWSHFGQTKPMGYRSHSR